VEIVEHAAEGDLERYAIRTHSVPESKRLEEHILICSACRTGWNPRINTLSAMRAVERNVAALCAHCGHTGRKESPAPGFGKQGVQVRKAVN
jgi:predicted anti-sigma-YlaC factor YlaD